MQKEDRMRQLEKNGKRMFRKDMQALYRTNTQVLPELSTVRIHKCYLSIDHISAT